MKNLIILLSFLLIASVVEARTAIATESSDGTSICFNASPETAVKLLVDKGIKSRTKSYVEYTDVEKNVINFKVTYTSSTYTLFVKNSWDINEWQKESESTRVADIRIIVKALLEEFVSGV